jgi:hypothetical protein
VFRIGGEHDQAGPQRRIWGRLEQHRVGPKAGVHELRLPLVGKGIGIADYGERWQVAVAHRVIAGHASVRHGSPPPRPMASGRRARLPSHLLLPSSCRWPRTMTYPVTSPHAHRMIMLWVRAIHGEDGLWGQRGGSDSAARSGPELIRHQNGDFVARIVPQVYPQTVPVMVSPLTVRVKFTRSTGAFSALTWKISVEFSRCPS